MTRSKILALAVGPLAFMLILWIGRPADMSPEAQAVIATTAWMAIWWITEAIPVGATSLLPLILFPLTGSLPIKNAAIGYANPLIYLFVGGFVMALAMENGTCTGGSPSISFSLREPTCAGSCLDS